MDILLSAQFAENLFTSTSDQCVASIEEEIRTTFTIAAGMLMRAGELFNEKKEELGRKFFKWVVDNHFVIGDANKLIDLFNNFGEGFDALNEVSVLQLLKTLIPSHDTSRDVLMGEIDLWRDGSREKLTCADVESIAIANRTSRTPTKNSAVVAAPSTNNEDVETSMVGNQFGGTGIFRLEVKNPELASQLDSELKQSGQTNGQWLNFLSSSARAVQEIAQVVLGRKLNDASELDELIVVVKKERGIEVSEVVIQQVSPLDTATLADNTELPTPVIECLNRLSNVFGKVEYFKSRPQGISSMMADACEMDRKRFMNQLEALSAEYGLNFDDLVARIVPMSFKSVLVAA
jgi:hypothetical protein